MSKVTGTEPKAVGDINYWQYLKKSDTLYYSLGSKEIDRYIKVSETQVKPIMEVIKLLDGNNSLDYIEEYLKKEKNIIIDVNKLFQLLKTVGLIEGFLPGRLNGELSIVGVELLSFKFPKTTKSVKNIARIMLVLWKVLFVMIVSCLLLSTILKWDYLDTLIDNMFIVKNSHILGLFWMMLFFFIASLLHELSHWCLAINYGLKPDKLKVTLYSGILPIIYVKINGLYTLEKKKRILVMSAGMLTNFLIFALSIIIVIWVDLPQNTSDIILKIAISNGYMIITNLIPFSITDGYFIFSWMIGISNLRINIIKSIKEKSRVKNYKLSKTSIAYLTIAIGLFIPAMISTFIWLYNITEEIIKLIPISIGSSIFIIAISISIVITVGNVILKFRRYLKE